MQDLDTIFNTLKKISVKHSKGLEEKNSLLGSKAKEQKPCYVLYGKQEVSIAGKKSQKMFVAGVIKQKNFVEFYLMSLY